MIRRALGQKRLWIGTLLGLVLLWLAFREIPLSDITEALRRARLAYLALALLSVLGTNLAKALRWRLLFYPDHTRLRLDRVFGILMTGQMVNILGPGRFGELVRAFLVGELEGESKAFALSTVVVEKLIDLLALGVLLTGCVPWIMLPNWVDQPGVLFVAAALVLLAVAAILSSQRARIMAWVGTLLVRLPGERWRPLARQLELALTGLSALGSPSIVVQVLVWTAIAWILAALTNALTFLALGLALPWIAAWFVLLVIQVGIAAPSSPGKLGVFQYLCILALSVFDVERSVGLTYGFVLQGIVFLPPIIWGAWFVGWQSLGLRRLTQLATETATSLGESH
jgi:uncharacterized protein (TIRG00374 family)